MLRMRPKVIDCGTRIGPVFFPEVTGASFDVPPHILDYLIELPGRKSSITAPLLPQIPLEKVGAKPPTSSTGFCGRRGPFRLPKVRISGPETLLPNLK